MRNSGGLLGRVFSSKYCRTRETAQYMGLVPVTATPAIMNMRAVELAVSGAYTGEAESAIFLPHGNR